MVRKRSRFSKYCSKMINPIEIRKSILKLCFEAKEGHIPSSFSIVDILTVLYKDVLKYHPENPDWEDRDYFILSKGHASVALYAVLQKAGYISENDLITFGKYDSPLGGHPDRNKVPGVEASTGSLGHGFPFAAGIALSMKIKCKPNYVYSLIGDGECNEGTIWETAMVAANCKLNNFIGILDLNESTSRCLPITNPVEKWSAFGWKVYDVNGHDINELKQTFRTISNCKTDRPSMVIARTVKGKGSKTLENNGFTWHHRSPTEEELKVILKELE